VREGSLIAERSKHLAAFIFRRLLDRQVLLDGIGKQSFSAQLFLPSKKTFANLNGKSLLIFASQV